LNSFKEDNLLEINDEGIKVTDTGRFFVRNIAMIFDAHLTKKAGLYSKTI